MIFTLTPFRRKVSSGGDVPSVSFVGLLVTQFGSFSPQLLTS